MNEDKIYYYDKFEECFVKQKDLFAAPERYLTVSCSKGEYYIDTFVLPNDKLVDFNWLPEDIKRWSELVIAYFKSINLTDYISVARLIKRKYPTKIFKEIEEEVEENEKN